MFSPEDARADDEFERDMTQDGRITDRQLVSFVVVRVEVNQKLV